MYSSAHGGATAKAPSTGWASPDLENIFSQTIPRENQHTRSDSPLPPSPNKPDSSTQSLSGGGIAGITLGAVVFMVIMTSGVLVWLRRRRKIPNDAPGSPANEQKNPELEGFGLHELDQLQAQPQEMAGSEVITNATMN